MSVNDPKLLQFIEDQSKQQLQRQQNSKARRVNLYQTQYELFLSQFKDLAKDIFKNKIVTTGYSQKNNKKISKRILNLLLSDLHIHALLDGREVPNEYGEKEESRRLAHVIQQTIDFKPQYREHTQLNVYLNGDIIEGQLLHDLNSGAPLTEQFTAALRYLVQAISILSANFPNVVVYCQSGNHGRILTRHKERANVNKWDSYEGMIFWALKTALEFGGIKNVTVEIPRTNYCAVPLFNKWAMVTHGDAGPINIGNPGKSVNVSNLEAQIAKINSTKAFGRAYDLFAVGHVHFGAHFLVGGADVVVNPALVPSNNFSLNHGYFSSCGQRLWESVPDHAFGDSRIIKVGPEQDNDDRLDKIIRPFYMDYDQDRFRKSSQRYKK